MTCDIQGIIRNITYLRFFLMNLVIQQLWDAIEHNDITYLEQNKDVIRDCSSFLLTDMKIPDCIDPGLCKKTLSGNVINKDDFFLAVLKLTPRTEEKPSLTFFLQNKLYNDPVHISKKIVSNLMDVSFYFQHFDINEKNSQGENFLLDVMNDYNLYETINFFDKIDFIIRNMSLFNFSIKSKSNNYFFEIFEDNFRSYEDSNMGDVDYDVFNKYLRLIEEIVSKSVFKGSALKTFNTYLLHENHYDLLQKNKDDLHWTFIENYTKKNITTFEKIILSLYDKGYNAHNVLLRFLNVHGLNYQDPVNGKNILHYLAEKGDSAKLDNLLLTSDIDYTLQDKKGNTPLHLAIEAFNKNYNDKNLFGNLIMTSINVLMNKENINWDAKNEKGQTVFDLVFSKENSSLIPIFINKQKELLNCVSIVQNNTLPNVRI